MDPEGKAERVLVAMTIERIGWHGTDTTETVGIAPRLEVTQREISERRGHAPPYRRCL